jgi:hypothetical protein
MTSYRRDPETGTVYAWGGTYGIRAIDAERERKDDWNAMLLRRLPEQLAARLPVSIGRRLAIEQQLGWTRAVDGKLLPTSTASAASSRPRRSSPRRSATPSRSGMLVAVEDFDYIDRYRGRVHVTAGVTNVTTTAQAYLARPSAFA